MTSFVSHTTIDCADAYALSQWWKQVLDHVELLALGARELAGRRTPDGRGWVTLADPEGNEFCLLRRSADAAPEQASPAS